METGGESLRLSRWPRLTREALPLLVLLAVAFKSMFDEWRTRHLTPGDETQYLGHAWHLSGALARSVKSDPMYVPLYVWWYRLLMLLPVDVEYLPFVSHGLLMALLVGLFYGLVRRLGAGRWAGAVAAGLLIANTRLADVEPFPVHMATALLAVGALVGTYRRSVLGACGPLGFAVLAACYVRNEFGTLLLLFLPFYLAAGAWAWWRYAACPREFLPWAVPLVAAVVVCWALVGVPLPDGPRGFCAFGQHYARNMAEARGGDSTEWDIHFQRLVREDFGDVRTVGAAVRARPGAVAWHVGRNLDRLPDVVYYMCRPRPALATTPRQPAHLLVLIGLVAGLVLVVRRVRAGGLRGPEGQPLRVLVLVVACAAVVSGPSVVLVYPREHYLLLPLFFLMALAVSGVPAPQWPLGWLGEPCRWKVRAVGIATAALLLALTPTARHEWTILRPLLTKVRPPEPTFEYRETMALLRALPQRPATIVMDHEGAGSGRVLWMAPPVIVVPHSDKTEGFRLFVARHRIEVVVLARELLSDARFAGDPEFMALWDGTDTGEFAIASSPGGARIAVRKDLLD
jgi:hypothetical protein